MKRVAGLVLCVLLLLSGCGMERARVFDTEKEIVGITFHRYLYGEYIDAEVAPENLAEVTYWLSTFKVGGKVDLNNLPTGIDTTDEITVFYADGSKVRQKLDITGADGQFYLTTREWMGDDWYWTHIPQ